MKFIILPLFFIAGIKAAGQPDSRLPGNTNPVEDSLVSIYYKYQMKGPAFLNGRVFHGYSASIQGHAFFLSIDWKQGSVLYDGLWYRNVDMVYDLSTDQLILRHPLNFAVILVSERVQEFTIGDHVFVNLETGEEKLQHGFYQRLNSGRATIYVKRIKNLEEKIDGMELERKFVQVDNFFIKKDGFFHPVERQKDLMRVLSEKMQELSRYKNEQKLRFKDNPELIIFLVTEHFNKL